MVEVLLFLKQCGVYYLATMDKEQPQVRPFGTIDIFEDRLYFQTAKNKPVSRQLKENPKIAISGLTDDGRWIRITAEAVLDDNLAAQQHILDQYPNLKTIYRAGDGNTEVYYLKNVIADFYSVTNEHYTIKF